MTTFTRRRLVIGGAAASTLATTTVIQAQPLPDVAKIFVGFPPGGAPDIVARRLAEQLTGKLAKSVVVDNRPGASGRLAIDAAKLTPADGTNLLLNPAGVLTINPHSFKKLSYDPFKDFTPLTLAANIDFGFAVGPMVPADVKNVADFIRWAKANPSKASFGSPAAGSPPHFVGDALGKNTGTELTHVPYKGATLALNDLGAGQIAAVVLTLGDLVQQAKAGRLRLLASTGPKRSRFTPELATFSEQKFAGFELRDWFAIYIAGNPTSDVTNRTSALLRTAISSPAYVEGLLAASLEAASSTPQDLDKLGREDLTKWASIVKSSGFVAD
jgi:tripartite-type tricarboxylate transporter receptor subunit TctC